MQNRRNKNLHIVRDHEDPADRVIADVMTEFNNEDGPVENMADMVRERKRKIRRKAAVRIAAVAGVAIVIFLIVYLQTYTKVRVADTYTVSGVNDSSYEEFADGVLKYSRDGIAYLNQKGEELWNQPCQIKNPFVDVNETTAAVADRGGNDIMIVQEEGVKGEIHTTLPIEKISVSKQGIVSVILKNESTPQIICYDTAGNILVEHKASMGGTGYPMDVTLSPNGEVMQVIYLNVQAGEITSRVVYYNFGKRGEEKSDHQVADKKYKDSILASGFYMNDSVSAVIGDNCLTIFKGKDAPKESVSIPVEKEIQSLFHNEKYIGMILKNEGKGGYELRLYNTSGKVKLSKEFKGTYKNAKLSGDQVILYDGKKCSIFLRNGIHRFEGEMDNNILEVFPIAGVNKYIVMNTNGMENVRLVK